MFYGDKKGFGKQMILIYLLDFIQPLSNRFLFMWTAVFIAVKRMKAHFLPLQKNKAKK